jgi:hypothetical protein
MPKMRILLAGRPRLRKGDPGGLTYDSRGRHQATRLVDDVIYLRCCCGREYGIDFGNAPPPHRVTGVGVELLFKRWQDGSSGAPCPDCLRAFRRTGRLPAKESNDGLPVR